MTTVDEIKQALDAWEWANSVGTTQEYLETKAMIASESPDWLRFLLAELDRLRAIEGAARDVDKRGVDPERYYVSVPGTAYIRLRDALAAFDAAKGE
jgi:hypothetical protein